MTVVTDLRMIHPYIHTHIQTDRQTDRHTQVDSITHEVEHAWALSVAGADSGLLEKRVQLQLLLPAAIHTNTH